MSKRLKCQRSYNFREVITCLGYHNVKEVILSKDLMSKKLLSQRGFNNKEF